MWRPSPLQPDLKDSTRQSPNFNVVPNWSNFNLHGCTSIDARGCTWTVSGTTLLDENEMLSAFVVHTRYSAPLREQSTPSAMVCITIYAMASTTCSPNAPYVRFVFITQYLPLIQILIFIINRPLQVTHLTGVCVVNNEVLIMHRNLWSTVTNTVA